MAIPPKITGWYHSRFLAQAAGALSILLGAIALFAWSSNSKALESFATGPIALTPNVSTGFVLCGLALALLAGNKSGKGLRFIMMALALAVIALGAAAFAECFLNWTFGMDKWLSHGFPTATGTSDPGRIKPAAAFCFVLIGIALVAETHLAGWRLRPALVAGLSTALALISVLAFAGSVIETVFGPSWNLGGPTFPSMFASVGFVILGTGLLALLQSKHELTWSVDSLTTAGFTSGAAVMVLAAALAFNQTKQMRQTSNLVTHRQEVLKKIEEVTTDMVDLASRERVFVITGIESFSTERQELKRKTAADLAEVRKLTSDNQNQQRRLDKLRVLIDERIDWEEQVITAYRKQGFVTAAQLVATGPGLKLSDDLRALLRQMQDDEYRLLEGDRARAQAASTSTFLLLPLGVFLGLTMLSLATFFLNSGVDERGQAEEALRRREAQLHTIVENLDEGVVVADLNGQLLHWNRAALELHGYALSEQDRRNFPDLVDTFELSSLNGSVLSVDEWPLALILRNEEVNDLELRVRRIGQEWERIFNYGGSLVHDKNGRPLMAIITIADITERKEAEAQLRASEQRYRLTFENSPLPMWVYDTETLRFLAVNEAAVDHYGYSRDEFLGMTIRDIRPPEELPALAESIAGAKPGLTARTERIWKHRKKDGTVIDVEITSHDLPFAGWAGRLVLANDVTDRQRAEEEIHRLNTELEQRVRQRTAELEAANKELEAFSYSVSHDLRAPLRAVDGFSQAVLEDYNAHLPKEGQHYLQTIRESAQRMGMLIDDLLTFSRLSRLPLKKQPDNPAAIVNNALEELNEERYGRKIEIHVGDLRECQADPALMKQVWINLLSNAIKYTRPREKAVVEVGSKPDNGETIYFVADNGTGFDARYARKLFGVFQRLHRAEEFEGTGVGLAIVQRVVHRHGGRVWAEAAVDRGATFYFTLPN